MDSSFSKLWLGPISSCKSPYRTCSRLRNEHSRMRPVSPTPAPTMLRYSFISQTLTALPKFGPSSFSLACHWLLWKGWEEKHEMRRSLRLTWSQASALLSSLSPAAGTLGSSSSSLAVPAPAARSLSGARPDAVLRSAWIKPAMFPIYKISFAVMALASPVEAQSFSNPGTQAKTFFSARTDAPLLLTAAGR